MRYLFSTTLSNGAGWSGSVSLEGGSATISSNLTGDAMPLQLSASGLSWSFNDACEMVRVGGSLVTYANILDASHPVFGEARLVSPVPEPSTWGALLLGFAALTRRFRSRR